MVLQFHLQQIFEGVCVNDRNERKDARCVINEDAE
jgi:hypothetical protein